MTDLGKTLQDQIAEVDQIVADAMAQLSQVRYALTTMEKRVAERERELSAGAARPAPACRD
jgi:phage shock protein A